MRLVDEHILAGRVPIDSAGYLSDLHASVAPENGGGDSKSH